MFAMERKTGYRRARIFTPVFLALSIMGVCAAQDAPKKVTKTEGLDAVTKRVPPDYPPMARQLKMEGTVEVEATVSETGTVEKVTVVSGNPVLTHAAADAVKKWKFAPFTSDGKAVKAVVPVSLTFKM
jgi:protein TonB